MYCFSHCSIQFDAPVSSQKGMFYNFGIQLKSGIYSKHSYLEHATRGNLNLHSLYFLLWANFSAFCVSLVTSQDADIRLRTLLSDDLPVRSYCISQLRSLWTYMRNSLHLLDEELAFLIQRCSDAIIQVSSCRILRTLFIVSYSHSLHIASSNVKVCVCVCVWGGGGGGGGGLHSRVVH